MNRSMLHSALGLLSCALLLPCSAAPGPAPGGTFDLFTAAEAGAWNTKSAASQRALSTQRSLERPGAEPGEAGCHSPPSASAGAATPVIKIVSPSLGQPLNAPIDIDVQFVPAAAAAIRPETFRVCYMGFLTVDITQRITDRVAVSPAGIRVGGAQLPSGHHHLLMLIADDQGHYGHQDVTFDIK